MQVFPSWFSASPFLWFRNMAIFLIGVQKTVCTVARKAYILKPFTADLKEEVVNKHYHRRSKLFQFPTRLLHCLVPLLQLVTGSSCDIHQRLNWSIPLWPEDSRGCDTPRKYIFTHNLKQKLQKVHSVSSDLAQISQTSFQMNNLQKCVSIC